MKHEDYYSQLREAKLDVGYLIGLLDEWIAGLEEEELRHNCRKSGNDFFKFLNDRGIPSNAIARIIINLTGINPAIAWKSEDLGVVVEFLFNYEATQICVTDDERKKTMGRRQRKSNAIARLEERWRQ